MRHLIVLLVMTTQGCLEGPGLFEQDGSADSYAVISSTEEGASTGVFSAASGVTQSLSADGSSEIGGASLSIPPGALSIDTNITIEAGLDVAALATSSLGVGSAVSSSTPVVISSSIALDTNSNMTIQLPLPSGASLALAENPYATLAVVYLSTKASQGGARFFGVIPRNQVQISGNFVKVGTRYFGSYQTVILDNVVEQAKEEPTDVEITTKREVSSPPGTFGFTKPEAEELDSKSLDVEWTGAERADFYHFWVSGSSNCSGTKKHDKPDLRTLKTLITLSGEGTFYICIEADNGKGDRTKINEFGYKVVYTEAPDAPDLPALTGTSPASPFESTTTSFKGTAPSNTTVEIFPNSDCSGPAVASGTAAEFSGNGIQGDNLPLHKIYYAKTKNSAGGESPCSPNGVRYSYPQLLEANAGGGDGINENDFRYAIPFNNGMLVSADSGNGDELHLFKDGAVTELKDINTAGGSFPRYMIDHGGVVYFSAYDDSSATDLWKTDGTSANTVQVPVNGGSSSYPSNFIKFNNKIFFKADGGGFGSEIFQIDESHTVSLMKDIYPSSGSSSPESLTVIGSHFYFSADDGSMGRELWKSDGTTGGTVMVKDISPSVGSSYPSYFTGLGSLIIFQANNGTSGYEPWVSDGTDVGTQMLVDINTGSSSSNPNNFVEFNGKVYFIAYTGSGYLLYRTDGTPGGTVAVSGLYTSAYNLNATSSYLIYSANDGGGTGMEPWVSDGSVSGDMPLADISPSSGSSNPNYFVVYQNRTYFIADSGGPNKQLYVTEGLAANTRQVTTTASGFGVCGSQFKVFDRDLYFYMDTTANGVEMYHAKAD